MLKKNQPVPSDLIEPGLEIGAEKLKGLLGKLCKCGAKVSGVINIAENCKAAKDCAEDCADSKIDNPI